MNVTTGYVPGEDGPRPAGPDPVEIERAGTSGGLVSTVTDLGRLLRCVLNGGELDGNRVLPADRVGTMTRRQSPPLPTTDGSDPRYGYGWAVDEFLDERLVTHRGGLPSASAYVGLLPERGVGIALACNYGAHPVVTLGKSLLALACGEEPTDTVRELRAYEAVERVTGTYQAHRGPARVTVEAALPGSVRIVLENRGDSFTAAPATLAADRYVFDRRDTNGGRWLAEFVDQGDGVELRLATGKWTTVLAKD